MKDLIKSLDIKNVVSYYGIKIERNMCICPFHNDKTASMKLNKNTFYCFACHENGDVIQFVQNYFDLDFISAMKKLNYDFALGINFDNPTKEDKILWAKQKQKLENEKRIKKDKKDKFIHLCNKINQYNNAINRLKSGINISNWENRTVCINSLREGKIRLLEYIEYNFIN